jgi:hypothetical protein
MDDSRATPAGGASITSDEQFRWGMRAMLLMFFWVSLWLGGWVGAQHYWDGIGMPSTLGEIFYWASLASIVVCPFAVFGLFVGRPVLGIVVGVIMASLFFVMLIIFGPGTQ